VRYGAENSRVDLLLEGDAPPCFVEIKNVTLSLGDRIAAFPDAITRRGAKHLRELEVVVDQGARAVLLFCVQLSDVDAVVAADALDPDYGAALRRAAQRGVEVLAWGCRVAAQEIVLAEPLAVRL
jgi:sugar fermentation stimulation protein A